MNTTPTKPVQNSMRSQSSSLSSSVILFSNTAISLRTPYPKNTPLNDDFQPGAFDVICGRGKTIFTHEGNQHFRQCIEGNAQRYHQARSKLDKSLIVIDIVDGIRSRSVTGGFVKAVKAKGAATDGRKTWVEIGDTFAREKVGHALRDAINGKHPTGFSRSCIAAAAAASKAQPAIKCMISQATINTPAAPPATPPVTPPPVPQLWKARRKSSLIIHEDDDDANNFLSLLTQLNASAEPQCRRRRRRSSELSFSLLLDGSLDFLDGSTADEQQELESLLTMDIGGEDDSEIALWARTKLTCL